MEIFRRINLRGRVRTYIREGLVLQLSFVASALHDRINEASESFAEDLETTLVPAFRMRGAYVFLASGWISPSE